MRIVLDLTAAASDHIEGTAGWAGIGPPVAFSGWLAIMRLLEDVQCREDGATSLSAKPDSLLAGRCELRLWALLCCLEHAR